MTTVLKIYQYMKTEKQFGAWMEVWKPVIYKGVARHKGVLRYMTCPEVCSTLPCAYLRQAETCLCHCVDVTWRPKPQSIFSWRSRMISIPIPQLITHLNVKHNATSYRHLRRL